jgi:hypothetical protein
MFRKTPLDQTAEQGGGVAVLRAAGLVGQEDFMSCDLLNDIKIYFLCSFYDSYFGFPCSAMRSTRLGSAQLELRHLPNQLLTSSE